MPGKYVLVWDAPNMDMGLGAILGGRPTAAHRPRFDAIGRWVVDRALERDAAPEASVFTNVTPGGAESIRGWVEAIRNVGFGVFAKPKLTEDSDVDPDMLDYLEANREQLAGVAVASADGQNFQQLLEELIDDNVPVTVLGFHEHAAWAVTHPDIEFVDLEDIEGVFREPLPRIDLDNLPDEGAWLQPFRSLTALIKE
ncbi:NYN domain-containing protein [uncultured Corynebacterium sp.]|uniref:NYN domain-containing protein n=1 Tax=uncultured Corynebacterium sp. TaxID=159447 RepID=UPI0025EABF87|nr:NYN domain-containing protein [uncultured Corynebacterium sp.]